MKYIKSKTKANRSKYLCWYESVHSREYDSLSLRRLDQVLEEYNNILKIANQVESEADDVNINVIELCSGQGRNIQTILKKLKPK